MRASVAMAAAGLAVLMTGCGTNTQERTSGGAAAGAATGATTKPSEVNLGKPPWTNPQARIPTPGQTTAVSRNTSADDLNAQSLDAAQHGQSYTP